MRFSERYGYKSVREIVQIESMDEPLRNALWNILKLCVWDDVHASTGMYAGYYLASPANKEVAQLCHRLWHGYFKKPLDTLDNNWSEVLRVLRGYFFDCEWYEVYDFIEFVAENYDRYGFKDSFMKACNSVLQKEMSAYRFIDGVITRITDEQEVEAIEQAISESIGPVQTHLRRALELLSDRESPDYRNSIKESISAVESLACDIAKTDKGTLGQLLKSMEDSVGIHPSLKAAFTKLYGYTSDESGIRHALLDSDTIQYEDAQFLLVVCSAFINFVNAKMK